MNKSKFQLEEEKKQSILNCINSITGDLTESVISAPGVDLIGSMRSTTDPLGSKNKRGGPPTPFFNPVVSPPPAGAISFGDAVNNAGSWIADKLFNSKESGPQNLMGNHPNQRRPTKSSDFKVNPIGNIAPVTLASLSTDNKQKYPFVARPPFMLQTQINSNLNNSKPSFASKASDNPYMSANPEEDKDFVGPPSSLKDPEQDKDFVGPPSSLMNTSSTRPGSPESTAGEIVNGNREVGTPNISGTKPAEWRGRNGMTVDELNADSNRIKSDMQNRGEPTSVGSPEWVAWKRTHAPTGVYDPTTVTRSTIDQDNSKLAADRQRGVARTGDRYQGTPGVGSFEQANRGKVGLDVGMNPDNSPEAVKKRSEEGMQRAFDAGWSQDPDGKMIDPEQTTARRKDSENKGWEPSTFEDEYLDKRRLEIATWNAGKEQRATNASERETKFHSDALKKLQDRTELTKARKDLEAEQSRKTNTSSSGSSRTVTEQAENTGAGGGSGNLGTSGDTSGDTSGITMSKEEENQWQTSVNKLKQMPNISDSMIAATDTVSRFAGKSALWALNNPVGKFAIGAVATPPENYFNTAMGSLGQLGFDNKNVAAHTNYYQSLLNLGTDKIPKSGIPLVNTIVNNIVEPAARNAASMATRMFLDPRSLPNSKKVNFGAKETNKDTDSEEETDNSVPISSNKPAPKQLTSKP